MIDKQKVQNVIKKLLDQEALYPYEKHDSSAQIFNTELRKHGFNPTIEIYHKYKFPKGYPEASFERHIFQQFYIYLFNPDRITNTEKYVQHFYEGTKVPKRLQMEYLTDLIKITGILSTEEKEYLVNYFLIEQPKAFSRMVAFLPEIKRMNPEIADTNPDKPLDFYNLYIGMTSRFHPEDIKYFSTLTDFTQANKYTDKIKSVLGFAPGFRIAPHRAKQLINEIIIQKQNNNK